MAVADPMLADAFRVDGLEKSYGAARVLADVDLEFVPGEVHALLGANGAGKSTLIKCLSGATSPSGGSLVIGGRRHSALTPRGALDAGIAVIYQHFSLIPTLSVADNVFLGAELRAPGGVSRRAAQEAAIRELFERLGVHISPRTRLGSLPVAQQQLVEIAKAIRREARLLILDEPTASLSSAETRALLEQVRRLREHGLAIVYVTHLLHEVFEVADRVTVLRDGRVSLQSHVEDVSPRELIEAIAGSVQTVDLEDDSSPGDLRLSVDALAGERLGPLSLAVRRGEIVGVFGLLGSGRTELLETLYGIRPRSGGAVTLDGRSLAPRNPVDAIRRGLALVPAERLRQSMFPSLSASDNVLLRQLGAVGRWGVRRLRAERAAYARIAALLGIRASGPDAPAWTLSGGNQQKLAVGRWLGEGGGVRLLMLDDPTQGIDVGARVELYRVLHRLARSSGIGVLFTSSSPEDLTSIADRAIVLHEGRIVGELARDELRDDRLLALAHQSELA